MRPWLVVVFALAAPRAALACAACGCGDPTLTTMGAEQPFGGRLRLSTELRYRTDEVGARAAEHSVLAEERLDSAVSYAPSRDWVVSAMLPVVRRDVEHTLSEERAISLGDAELVAKWVLYRDRWFAPHHLVSLLGGLKLPTAPIEDDASGRPLSSDVQPGTGSFDPLLGIAYAYFDDPGSAYASAMVRLPVGGRAGLAVGPSLRTTLHVQHQEGTAFALRLGLDTRLDGRAKLGAATDPDSGGFIAFVSPALVISATPDLLVECVIRIPFWNALDGTHREGPILSAGLTYDL